MDDSNGATASSQASESTRLGQSALEDNSSDSLQNGNSGPVQSRELYDSVLNFLSTSSNEALIGVVACLMAATYVVLGRLGLILIGTVLGVILHASWEGMSDGCAVHESGVPNTRRREFALNIVNKLLDWPKREPEVLDTKSVSEHIDLDYSTFRPKTAAALKSLTDSVIKDYVNYWYEPILPSESTFPQSCRTILTDFVTSVSSHLARKRTADTFLAFLTNSSSMIVVFLNELSTALETASSSTAPEQSIVQYLESFPDSSLANVLADQQQRKKLNMIGDDILSSFLDQKAYSCSPVRDFLREILAGVIFQSILSNLSRPEFINGWIIYLLSEGESEIMNAIDAGVQGARNQGVTASKNPDVSNPSDLNAADNVESSPQTSFGTSEQQPNNGDEEAIWETKRLSAMIAAQDAERQDSQQTVHDVRRSSDITQNCTVDTSSSHWDTDTIGNSVGKHAPETGSEDMSQILDTNEQMSRNGQRRPSSSSDTPNSLSKSNDLTSELVSRSSLTLHGASVSVDDGSEPGDGPLIRSKPTSNYLIQIEPASTRCTGWMTFKKYSDFESLHDTLETISRFNRIRSFAEAHPVLPPWKGHTRKVLARNLERYVQDALQHESLAESEKMKRFLDKDRRLGIDPAGLSAKTGFPFPSQTAFENMGKGVLDALTNAPKGVAGGSKAVLGGVTGVFGGVGSNSKRSSQLLASGNDGQVRNPAASDESLIHAGAEQMTDSRAHRFSLDFSMDSKHCASPTESAEKRNPSIHNSCSSASSLKGTGTLQNAPFDTTVGKERSSIDPPTGQRDTEVATLPEKMEFLYDDLPELLRPDGNECEGNPTLSSQDSKAKETNPHQPATSGPNASSQPSGAITHDETQIAVELIFAVINELYTMSSVWNIRRTLLNAAKSYILRPGSPTLETIRASLQDSIIDANTSDESMGLYLTKVRENALPTEIEMNNWPPPPNDVEKERLRKNARRLLVQRGLPQELTSVMGAVASREALEKIFDCLQVETIARGLVFSILLQGLRAVII